MNPGALLATGANLLRTLYCETKLPRELCRPFILVLEHQ